MKHYANTNVQHTVSDTWSFLAIGLAVSTHTTFRALANAIN